MFQLLKLLYGLGCALLVFVSPFCCAVLPGGRGPCAVLFWVAPLIPYLALSPLFAHPVAFCIGLGVVTHVAVDSLVVGVHVVVGNSVVGEVDSPVVGHEVY